VILNVGLGAFGLFLKPLTIEFGWTTAMAFGAYSLCMLVYGVLSIAMGGLSDKFGPRLVLTLSGFLSGAGFLLMSRLNALWQLYLFFGVLVAAGMSGIWIPQLSTVSRWFVKRRSLMTGVVVAGIGIGGLIEPPVISRLIKAYGWRLSLVIMGCTVLVVIVIIAQFLKRDPKQMGLSAYGEVEEGRRAVTPEMNEFSFKEAVHTVQFWLATVTFICLGYGAVSIMVHIVRHAMDLEISAVSAANILAVNGGIAILGS
jgi:sugar phosphate permease